MGTTPVCTRSASEQNAPSTPKALVGREDAQSPLASLAPRFSCAAARPTWRRRPSRCSTRAGPRAGDGGVARPGRCWPPRSCPDPASPSSPGAGVRPRSRRLARRSSVANSAWTLGAITLRKRRVGEQQTVLQQSGGVDHAAQQRIPDAVISPSTRSSCVILSATSAFATVTRALSLQRDHRRLLLRARYWGATHPRPVCRLLLRQPAGDARGQPAQPAGHQVAAVAADGDERLHSARGCGSPGSSGVSASFPL